MLRTYSPEFLYQLRNEIPIDWLIQHMDWPNKRRHGQFVFVCPYCQESESDINPETNLARCYHCETNFNPIDFAIAVTDMDFVRAVEYLTPFLPK